DARRHAHRRYRATRRDKRDLVTRADRERVGEPAANGDALPLIEAFQGPLLDIVGDGGKLFEVLKPDAADKNAAGVERRGSEGLSLDNWRGEPDARHLVDARGDVRPIGERLFQRLDQEMAVNAENLAQKLMPEAVHHRHDDDERRHAEHDAEEGEPGNNRDESFFAPRPQVAQREHPFVRRKGTSPGGLSHEWYIPMPGFSHDSGSFKPPAVNKVIGGTQDSAVGKAEAGTFVTVTGSASR